MKKTGGTITECLFYSRGKTYHVGIYSMFFFFVCVHSSLIYRAESIRGLLFARAYRVFESRLMRLTNGHFARYARDESRLVTRRALEIAAVAARGRCCINDVMHRERPSGRGIYTSGIHCAHTSGHRSNFQSHTLFKWLRTRLHSLCGATQR